MSALTGKSSPRAPELTPPADQASIDKTAPPSSPQELRAYIPYLVNRLSYRISADQNGFLATVNLNNAAFRTLSVLHIYRRLTVNEISVLAVIEQSNASRTIEQMLEAGLVKRQNSAADQRRREVTLTRSGQALLRKIWPKIALRYENLTAGVSREEIDVCASVLSRMIDNVRKHEL